MDQSSLIEILSHLPETLPACLAKVMQQRTSAWAFQDSVSAEGDNSAALGNQLPCLIKELGPKFRFFDDYKSFNFDMQEFIGPQVYSCGL